MKPRIAKAHPCKKRKDGPPSCVLDLGEIKTKDKGGPPADGSSEPMRMKTINAKLAVLLLFAASRAVPAQSLGGTCPLSTFKSGQLVTIHGKVGQAPHDMVLVISGCSKAVVLMYAGDLLSGESGGKSRKDKNLKQFKKYTQATVEEAGRKSITTQGPKYEVEATLTGRLDIAPESLPEGQWKDKLGMLHDQSGKFVGKAGFGHPPIYDFQLMIKSVSNVSARELSKSRVSTDRNSNEPTSRRVAHPLIFLN